MNQLEKAVGTVDRFQQRQPWLAFPVAVWRKFSNDRAGNLAALISYYAVAAIFPLLLVLGTVLNIVLRNNAALQQRLIKSALAQYPVIGPEIKSQLGQVSGNGLALVFGIVLLLYGARGVASAMQNAMCEVWGVPREDRPGFPLSLGYNFLLILTVGTGFVLTSFLSGVAGGAGHLLTGAGAHIGAVIISFVLNVAMFWTAFRLASVRKVRWHDLRIGAVVAAFVWTVLQLAGGYVVSHQLHRASSLYGTFGVVLGLMAWMYLQSEVTLYAAEIDVVLVRKLWPRSLKFDSGKSESGERRDPRVPGQRSGSDRAGDAEDPAAKGPEGSSEGSEDVEGSEAKDAEGSGATDGKGSGSKETRAA